MNLDFFRDQIWPFIGVLIAFLALIITIIISIFQKKKKAITYEILSKYNLLTSKEKLEGKIKVLYEGIEVNDVQFLLIRIENSGKVGIPKSDYERPISFIFEPETAIISGEVTFAKPASLITNLDIIDQNEIVLNPVLMNSKDVLEIKLILANTIDEKFSVDGRIKDVKDILKKKPSIFPYIFAFIGAIMVVIGFIQYISIQKAEQPDIPL